MEKDTTNTQVMSMTSRDMLTDILRQGAQKMLAMAIENEVAEYIAGHQQMQDANGHRLVTRNGHPAPGRGSKYGWLAALVR